ncbi:hypothetical protein P7C70_g2711, partial [Phenoliferia sp. Uapishka_3]
MSRSRSSVIQTREGRNSCLPNSACAKFSLILHCCPSSLTTQISPTFHLPTFQTHPNPLKMVKIEEVSPDQDWESDSDAGSISSEVSDDEPLPAFDPSQETFAERIAALKDIVSPATRLAISEGAASTVSWVKWGAGMAGSVAWVVTTREGVLGSASEFIFLALSSSYLISTRYFLYPPLPTPHPDHRANVPLSTSPSSLDRQAAPANTFGAPAPGAQPSGVVPPGF